MAKGSAFERYVAKTLTFWLSGKEKPYIFWRSPGSGMIQTLSLCQEGMSGDIIAVKDEGKFFTNLISLEAKNGYRHADFHKHFKNIKNNEINDFWKQCIGDARKAGKWGMLIYRKKGHKVIIGLEKSVADCFDGLIKLRSLTLHFTNDLPDAVFFDFEDFLSVIKPEDIKSKIKTYSGSCNAT
jgi:hypothetical protein